MTNIPHLLDSNILLLQGPIGFFFKKLDKELRGSGANTYRIGFNMGDQLFSHSDNYTAYRDTTDKWPSYIKDYLKKYKINKIFVFGDCRYYQSILISIACKLNIEVYVFEEGYIRPHYITLERYGVNHYSHLPRDANFYSNLELQELPTAKDARPNPILNWSIVILYYFVAKLFHFRYKHYKHHRNYSATQEFFLGIRSLIRKPIYFHQDKKYLSYIKKEISKKYFFVPLQTYNDFQILEHSNYENMEHFILEVLTSFSKNAQKQTLLVFKHHPLDRGRKNYKNFIKNEAKKLRIEQKILILHDIHLPTCLKHARGTITINSTVGLSSLYHGIPTITLGNAIYDIEGLTCKNMSLNHFWFDYKTPDMHLLKRYRQYIIQHTQLNGSFFGLFPTELTTRNDKKESLKAK